MLLQGSPMQAQPMQNFNGHPVDAGAGLGQPVSYRAMRRAIEAAQQYGSGFITVRNSNHYGIAGYYAKAVLREG